MIIARLGFVISLILIICANFDKAGSSDERPFEKLDNEVLGKIKNLEIPDDREKERMRDLAKSIFLDAQVQRTW